MSMPFTTSPRSQSPWLQVCLGFPLMLAAAALGAGAVKGAESRVLYDLSTRCSVAGAAPTTCMVEAVDEGAATLYRHRIGSVTMTVRITDRPLRMERWNGAKKAWQPLKEAAARFSTNTICFNGRDLCVVNPNYLNSIREERPDATAGRDLVMVRFDKTGRVNLSCYDDGCKEVKS
ncbi:MAG: hypothetical protein VKK94_04335 [Cyanobacteriota bacterium]|nr:hypothetical protein [Cyanobacteriota bacterium]